MAEESPQVRALKQRYQSSLADKARDVGELIDKLAGNEGGAKLSVTTANGDLIADYLHRLAGSSGMYGYDDIASLARSAIADQRQGDKVSLAANLVQLRSLLDKYSRG